MPNVRDFANYSYPVIYRITRIRKLSAKKWRGQRNGTKFGGLRVEEWAGCTKFERQHGSWPVSPKPAGMATIDSTTPLLCRQMAFLRPTMHLYPESTQNHLITMDIY